MQELHPNLRCYVWPVSLGRPHYSRLYRRPPMTMIDLRLVDAPVQAPLLTQRLMAKLSRRDTLSEDERRAIDPILGRLCHHVAGADILTAGAQPTTSQLLVSGLAARTSGMFQGARTVTQLSVAGDFIDLHSLVMKQIDHGVSAITDCITASVPHADLTRIIESFPHLARLLWLEIAVDGAIQREWFHRLARQEALGRTAHFLCELHARLEAVELTDGAGFEFKMTQKDLADCLGVTTVHVNRTLAELRRRNLVDWRGGWVELLNRTALAELAEFDPRYLRLQCAPV